MSGARELRAAKDEVMRRQYAYLASGFLPSTALASAFQDFKGELDAPPKLAKWVAIHLNILTRKGR